MTEASTNLLMGIYGGTFDPVHHGHLKPVSEAAHQLSMDRVTLIPCHIPPHKAGPSASAAHRLAMLKCAIEQAPLFAIDTQELEKDRSSYSYQTLKAIKQANPERHLCFFMGMDSLLNFDKWYRWQDLLSLSHFVVCRRHVEGEASLGSLASGLTPHLSKNPQDLRTQSAGTILLLNTHYQDVSSTKLRQRIANNAPYRHLMPVPVANYIEHHKLYRTQPGI